MNCAAPTKACLTYSPSIVAASVKVLEEWATRDAQWAFAPGSFKSRAASRAGQLQEQLVVIVYK
jgi:hypothetical protein